MEKKKVAVPLVCHGHSRPVVDLFYSPVTPDGFFLISASKDSNPMLRNGETGGHKGAVWSCCLDTNALHAASGSADFSAYLMRPTRYPAHGFADYFGRAFASVNTSQFPWAKMFKESPVSKMVDIPLCHITEPVRKTASDWINQRFDAIRSSMLSYDIEVAKKL